MLLSLINLLLVTGILAQPPVTSIAVTRKQGDVARCAGNLLICQSLPSLLFLLLLLLLLMPLLLLLCRFDRTLVSSSIWLKAIISNPDGDPSILLGFRVFFTTILILFTIFSSTLIFPKLGDRPHRGQGKPLR